MAPFGLRRGRQPSETHLDIPAQAIRDVYPNRQAQQAEFPDNVVITSHYTAWNFIPKFLFQQFKRFANAYFLSVCILQMIPAITITNGIPSSLLPLASVLLFDAVVTAREDYKRHQDDARDNARPTRVLKDGAFVLTPWRDIRVGDIVEIRRGEVFPADILFLRATTDDGTSPECCYVQTAQLDGETNLKLKQAQPVTVELFKTEADLAAFQGVVQAEAPNGIFGRFTASLKMSDDGPGYPLEADQLLLRGCVLRNVVSIVGIVVYTGINTKIRVKQTEIKIKRAKVERNINQNMIALMFAVFCTCVAGAIANWIWNSQHLQGTWYMDLPEPTFGLFILRIASYFLLNANMIPVSLYVSMKMARTAQKFFMEFDKEMYYEEPALVESSHGEEGQFPMQCRSMDLNDELGQVTHIFSDKTGTFTLNYMEFRKVSVRGVAYGLGTTEIGLDRMKREGQDTREMEALMSTAAKSSARGVPHVNFQDGSETHPGRSLGADLAALDSSDTVGGGPWHTHMFMVHLIVNHTVIPETLRDEEGKVTGTQMSASSPDEEAFVYFAGTQGYRFVHRSAEELTVNIRGQDVTYTVLHILAYNQMRKRMSVIVRDPLGKIYLFCKGADSVILERLQHYPAEAIRRARAAKGGNHAAEFKAEDISSDGQQANEEDVVAANVVSQLAMWGGDGLRTLVFSFRELEEDMYNAWSEKYVAARGDIQELEKRKANQPNRIDDLMNEIESSMLLQGATANEDKLQPGVPDTIASLRAAGISVWMLTGDKQETAVNIGFATRMLSESMEQLVLTEDTCGSIESAAQALRECPWQIGQEGPDKALIIDEKCLDIIVKNKADKAHLLHITQCCKAVICCRARPDQKKEMVLLIRKGIPGTITLAIGDGANDVDMIQAAHVGVGIAGAEGVQAANAADYAIGRFRFLGRLLLVHGRWNYRRMSKLVCYMLYKNIVLVLSQFWFATMCGWSGQKYYVELATQTFNIVYTGPVIVILGCMDQDVSAENAMRFPQLYQEGMRGMHFNPKVLWGWIFSGVLESILIFTFILFGTNHTSFGDSTPYVFELGAHTFTAVVLVTNMRLALEMHVHNWFFQFWLFICVVAWPTLAFIFDAWDADGMKGGFQFVFGAPAVWLACAAIVAVSYLRMLAIKYWKRAFDPNLRHIVQEAQLITHKYDRLEKKLFRGASPVPGASKTQTPASVSLLEAVDEPLEEEDSYNIMLTPPSSAVAPRLSAVGTPAEPPAPHTHGSERGTGFDFSTDEAHTETMARQYGKDGEHSRSQTNLVALPQRPARPSSYGAPSPAARRPVAPMEISLSMRDDRNVFEAEGHVATDSQLDE